MASSDRTSVLFVCLGNICRSPIAEGIFVNLINEQGVADRFFVDSAGTGSWHIGEPPDSRAQAVAREHGIVLPSRGRQVGPDDISRFEYLIAMDQSNADDLLQLGAREDQVRLLLGFDTSNHLQDVPDPYWGGPEGFGTVFQLVDRACRAFLDHLLANPS